MFVTAEKGEGYVYHFLFFPFFVSCFPRDYKLRQAEHLQTMNAQTSFEDSSF